MARESKRKRDERRFGKAERLADSIFTLEWILPRWCQSLYGNADFIKYCRDRRDIILECVSAFPCVVADNVGEFFFATSSQDYWDYGTDFPECRPPFSGMWIEFSRPTCINADGELRPADTIPDQWGWLIECESRDAIGSKLKDPKVRDLAISQTWRGLENLASQCDLAMITEVLESKDATRIQSLGTLERSYIDMARVYVYLTEQLQGSYELPSECQSMARCTLVQRHKDKIVSWDDTTIVLNQDGTLMGCPMHTIIGGHLAGSLSTDIASNSGKLLSPMALALSFMNCKNVTVNAVEPDHELNRLRKRQGHRPFVRYHTINIDPMKKILRAEGGLGHQGLKKSLHLCRGHFATYTQEKPLFGKHAGRFWISQHVRGTDAHGIVVSDYNVKAPQAGGSGIQPV